MEESAQSHKQRIWNAEQLILRVSTLEITSSSIQERESSKAIWDCGSDRCGEKADSTAQGGTRGGGSDLDDAVVETFAAVGCVQDHSLSGLSFGGRQHKIDLQEQALLLSMWTLCLSSKLTWQVIRVGETRLCNWWTKWDSFFGSAG